jgi:hypothetical protein
MEVPLWLHIGDQHVVLLDCVGSESGSGNIYCVTCIMQRSTKYMWASMFAARLIRVYFEHYYCEGLCTSH